MRATGRVAPSFSMRENHLPLSCGTSTFQQECRNVTRGLVIAGFDPSGISTASGAVETTATLARTALGEVVVAGFLSAPHTGHKPDLFPFFIHLLFF